MWSDEPCTRIFDSREALIDGIVDEASTDLDAALSQAGEPPERRDLATAVSGIAVMAGR